MHGGVAQGIAGALYETLAYDEHGQLLNASFMDFLMPVRHRDAAANSRLGHQETPSPLNPLGIKGAGEAGVIPVSAVIASAVEDAMGFRISAMPLNPSRLFDLRRGLRRPAAIESHWQRGRNPGMKISGSSVLHAPPEQVWAAITDPAVLAGVIPGCDVLTPIGRDRFALTVTLGVASIKGVLHR